MVRRQISVQDDNAFTASGVIKGKRITVSLVPAISRRTLRTPNSGIRESLSRTTGSVFLNIPASSISVPTQVVGTLTPGTFRADGFGVEVLFQVGIVKHVTKGRTGKLGVTHIEVGSKHADGEAWQVSKPVALEELSSPGLLRLAIQASRCVGMAYPCGWAVDEKGAGLGCFVTGDVVPDNMRTIYGVQSLPFDSHIGKHCVGKMDSVCTIELWDAGEVVLDESSVRFLIGAKPAGRKQERGSMSDPKVLRIVAKLYKEANHNSDGLGIPQYVRRELLARYGIINSESWVRGMGVKARKAGLLEQGKRKVKK